MKKRGLFNLFLAAVFAGPLASCGNDNVKNTITNESEYEDFMDYKKRTAVEYAYVQLLKIYPGLSFENFLKYGLKKKSEDTYIYDRKNVCLTYNRNENTMIRTDKINGLREEYEIIKDEPIKVSEYELRNDEYHLTFRLFFGYHSKIEIRYGENEKVSISYNYVDNVWVYDTKEEKTYNENLKLVSRVFYNYIDNVWVYDTKIESTYNENLKLVSKVYYNYIDNAWVYDTKEEHTYDEKGNTLSWATYNYIDNAWVYDAKYENTYDEKGNKLSWISYNYIDNAWVYNKKTEWTYDENGNELSEIAYIFIDNEFLKYGEWRRVFYRDSYLILMVYKLYFNEDYTPKGKVEYTYDENGSIKIISFYKDGIWTYQTKRECPIEGVIKEYYYVNGEWVLQN